MREIKFRAWSNDINDMFFKGDSYGTTHDTDCITYARSQDVVLMQYTGLKDKNGTDIYEGDVVFLEPYLKRSPAKVSFKGGSFGLEWDGLFSPMQLTQSDTMEVIGNIWESPELLEE